MRALHIMAGRLVNDELISPPTLGSDRQAVENLAGGRETVSTLAGNAFACALAEYSICDEEVRLVIKVTAMDLRGTFEGILGRVLDIVSAEEGFAIHEHRNLYDRDQNRMWDVTISILRPTKISATNLELADEGFVSSILKTIVIRSR
ncbi:MAG: hypothetical protein OXI55_14800 [Gammaproteobacteria bacterium]|nr:hypothetical protein [Gammaproteobacteria bacterium]